MKNKYLIGTDIGGTSFSSALFNCNYKIISISKKYYIADYTNKNDLLNAITTQIMNLSKDKIINGIGFSCPGPLKAELGMILNTPNLILLQNCNLKKEMEGRLKIPCLIENDANLFTLGEYIYTNKKKNVFVGVTLGTGLGFGIIINDKMFLGGNSMAGEYGISPIQNSNWEERISIKWIV